MSGGDLRLYMLWIILGIIISYFVGSIPTAYLFGRALKGIDIRSFGSGNVGATNAMRLLGKRAGVSVLLIDIIKGALPVIFLADYILTKQVNFPAAILRIILGIACICGHNWTVFLNFKGGKGVATTFGALIGLAFKITIFAKIISLMILIWLTVFLLTRIISLASLLAAISFPIMMFLFKEAATLLIFSIVMASFIVLRHRANLTRIFQGKEPRLYFKKSKK